MHRFVTAIIAFALSATCALAPQSAEANRVWPIYGAGGDGKVRVDCPEGEALVGFDGRTGDVIDQVQLMCARLSTMERSAPRMQRATRSEGLAAGNEIQWPVRLTRGCTTLKFF